MANAVGEGGGVGGCGDARVDARVDNTDRMRSGGI